MQVKQKMEKKKKKKKKKKNNNNNNNKQQQQSSSSGRGTRKDVQVKQGDEEAKHSSICCAGGIQTSLPSELGLMPHSGKTNLFGLFHIISFMNKESHQASMVCI